jgi:hypothetical protein
MAATFAPMVWAGAHVRGARVEEVVDSSTFVAEDQPERLAELIRGFAVPA